MHFAGCIWKGYDIAACHLSRKCHLHECWITGQPLLLQLELNGTDQNKRVSWLWLLAWEGTKNLRINRLESEDLGQREMTLWWVVAGPLRMHHGTCLAVPQRCFGTNDDEAGKLVNIYGTIKVPRKCRCQTQTLNALQGFWRLPPFALPTYEISCVIIGSMCIVLLGSSKIEKLVTFFVGAPFESSRHRPELGQLCGDGWSWSCQEPKGAGWLW